MAHRLDVLMKARGATNAHVAESVGCSKNYISQVRRGVKPGLKLAVVLCGLFPGLTLSDLGIDIDAGIAAPPENKGKAA